jgi:hypothetical protein
MTYSFPALSRRRITAILFGAGAFVLAACQGVTNSSSVGPLPKINLNPASANAAPIYSFVPYTLPSTLPYNNVEITGVNSNKGTTYNPNLRISGVYFNTPRASATTLYHSFTAQQSTGTGQCGDSGYTCPTTDPSNPPSGSNIYINEISIQAGNGYSFSVGYAPEFTTTSGCSSTGAICGVVYDPRAKTSNPLHLQRINVGSCNATYLYGTSDPLIQVGYYMKGANCLHAQAFEEYLSPKGASSSSTTPVVVDFHLPPSWKSTGSMAYGINNKGDVVGAYTTGTADVEIGWEYHEFCYYPIQYETFETQARGINWAGIVVGTYEDQVTTGQIPNGFVESGGMPYTENDGTDETGTVVNNINDNDTIVGYHVGGGKHGDYMGFTATCKSGSGTHPCAATPPPSPSCESQLGTDGANDFATRRRP